MINKAIVALTFAITEDIIPETDVGALKDEGGLLEKSKIWATNKQAKKGRT